MKTRHKYLALAALALMPCFRALAQDVEIDLSKNTSLVGSDQATWSDGVTTVKYIFDYYKTGAFLDGWSRNTYNMTVSSIKTIAVIEFEGERNKNNASKTTNILCDNGTLNMHPDEVSVWQGSSNSIKFYGDTSNDYYLFTKMRIWFVGTPYGKQYVADPTITAADGTVSFATATPGATFTYSMKLTTDGKFHMSDGTEPLALPLVVNVHGEAAGFENSTTTTQTIPFATLYGKQGDTDGNGRLNLADLQAIINNLLKKSAK